jgi:hypothetical protein
MLTSERNALINEIDAAAAAAAGDVGAQGTPPQ